MEKNTHTKAQRSKHMQESRRNQCKDTIHVFGCMYLLVLASRDAMSWCFVVVNQALHVQGVCLVTCVPMWNHDRTYLKHTGSGSTGANKMVISLEPGSRRPSSCSQSTKQVLCEFEGEISRDKNRSYAGDKDRREKKIWVEEVKEDFFPPFCKENKTHFYTYFEFWTKIWEV